jgi:hypothetical protein
VDSEGNVYIADGTADGNIRIRRVAAADGTITTVAGNGSQGYSGDGGAGKSAQFRTLGGLATDALGNLYIADNFNNRIRMVSAATGVVTTVAGNGVAGLSGDGGLARNAELNNPLSVAVDSAGNLFIADSGNFRVRRVNAANGTITTVGNGGLVYQDNQHGFPCSLAFDAAGDLYIADFGAPRLRRVPANATGDAAPFTPVVQSFASGSGFKINVTYDPSVSSTAQAAFNTVVNTYQNIFTTNITVNLYVTFGNTGLGQSVTQQQYFSYSTWRAAMIANANANPGNAYAVAAAASLPSSDPIGNNTVVLNTANARALGLNASVSVDSTITFSNAAAFEYTGVATPNTSDFMDTAAHELDEALGIGSALTGLSDNAAVPGGDYAAEDYFRFSASGTRAITTNPNATVYFSYNGGSANVAQFNQSYSAQGDTDLDRNDWIYGNFGCPSATTYVQDAIACEGQAVAIGSGPEIIVLSALGYDSSLSQTITFPAISNVTFGVAPFTISATASSGLAVSFTSTKPAVCTVSGSTVTVVAVGTCSITANQAGNATYSAAPAVSRSFTISQGAQTISFGALPNVTFGVAPFTISATATSGLAMSFASTTTTVCTVSGSTVAIVGSGACSITASQPGNANYLAAAPVVRSFTVNPGVAAASVSPASGSATTQTFTFTFSDSAGYSNLSVVDVLINNYLDGQQACYLALSPASASSGYLYLVDDAGDGLYVSGSPLLLPSGTNLHNNQCTINGTGSSVSGSGNTLTLTLAITFALNFDSMAGTGWTCSNSAPTCTRSDSLAPGSSYPPITVTLDVQPTAPAPLLTSNVAIVSGGGSETAEGNDPVNIVPVSAGCSYSINPSIFSPTGNASASSVAVTTSSGCAWIAVSNTPWLTITSGASGSGSGSVNFTAGANPVSQPRTGTLTIAGQTFTVNQAAPTLAPASVSPAAGSALSQTFTFTFTDQAGFSDLSVLDVLINDYLDGIGACYFALAPASAASGYLYLVDDAGDGGYVSGTPMFLPSSGSLTNSQCTLNGAGSSISASGNTLTLTLSITIKAVFAGNRIFYIAARSNTQNSDWQALGTWNVPGGAPAGPAVSGVSPAQSTTNVNYFAFTFTDSNGYADLGVVDVLINSFLDGINACYFAYVPTGATTGYMYLVDDAGDGRYVAGSPAPVPGNTALLNSQCTVYNVSSTATRNTLTLTVEISFNTFNFAGNQVFYVAARNNSTGNSGWQAVGSVTVP